MTITKKTIYKKQGTRWIIDSVITSDIVNILLNDDMIAKYLYKYNDIRIKKGYGCIVVNYRNNTKAIYE